MSVLTVGGRRFAAGLYWLERGGASSVARNARSFRRPWHVHWGGQTGYAADEENPKGCPSLAASLHAHIGAPTWMALVEADDGRLALVKARDGAILADGDEVFSERAAALEAFERSRGVGWALHATPGLVEGEVTEIDPASLGDDPAMRLAAAPLSMLRLPKVGRLLALAVVVAGIAFVWTQRETLWTLNEKQTSAHMEEAVAQDPGAVLREVLGSRLRARSRWDDALKGSSRRCRLSCHSASLRDSPPNECCRDASAPCRARRGRATVSSAPGSRWPARAQRAHRSRRALG